ncbi:coiled-coil domain-containing protein [Alkaliphilus transvaalensis]|uniref:hypothetical protein n=1 Tax=Alkaliphilus transvaalensis TaxID=114628 RepID=UPI00047CE3E2|nr:hypothetical protein [Alkaliphilus transvaalensis]
MEELLKEILSKLEILDEKVIKLDCKVESFDGQIQNLTNKIIKVDEKILKLDARVSNLETKVASLDDRELNIEFGQKRIEKKFDSLSGQLPDLREFKRSTYDSLTIIKKEVTFIKHKLHQNEEDIFDIKNSLKSK